jgi:hypothetical protein
LVEGRVEVARDVGRDDAERVPDVVVEEDRPDAERDGEQRERAGEHHEQLRSEQLRAEAAPQPQQRVHSPVPIR